MGRKGDQEVPRKKHSPDEVIRKLRQAEAWLNEGQTMAQVIQKLEVTEQTYYRWRNSYGGMKADEMKRLKELEEENRRLKRAVADLTLDCQILKEVNQGKW
jgi:transposase-like protein